VNRSIHRLYLAVVVGFALLAGFLGWWQVVAADDLEARQGNPLTAEREREVDRGRIISADGQVLARSVPVASGGRTTYRRVYPQGALAPHLVGYATPAQGRTGIEASYNRYLAGSFGTEPLLQRLNLAEKRGADVELTLDTRVQRSAVDGLGDRAGAVVALDPRTGRVLAFASGPTYNLNDVAGSFDEIRARPGGPLLARPTQGRQPPGSTFKVVTTTAALESGIYTPDSRFVDTGSYDTPGGPITNFGGRVWGPHDLEFALTNSINTTFASIGDTLGSGRLGASMSAFGFGERPEMPDLPDTMLVASGRFDGRTLLANDEPGIDAARLAIGQEKLLATPMQMALVAATVANGGTLRRPWVVARVRDRGGDVVKEGRPRTLRQAMPPDVAASISAMMRSVVREGTGTAAALAGLEVAGKTGTAETGEAGRNQAWFIGFAPATDPVVAVAVLVEDTRGTGGGEAAPIAGAVMRAAVEAAG
jgi:peptidoglycan glycosyltransferase